MSAAAAVPPEAYPLADGAALAAALEPEAGTVLVGGEALPVAYACARLPPYWFPIVSPADLDAKLADLAAMVPPEIEPVAPVSGGREMAPGDCWA